MEAVSGFDLGKASCSSWFPRGQRLHALVRECLDPIQSSHWRLGIDFPHLILRNGRRKSHWKGWPRALSESRDELFQPYRMSLEDSGHVEHAASAMQIRSSHWRINFFQNPDVRWSRTVSGHHPSTAAESDFRELVHTDQSEISPLLLESPHAPHSPACLPQVARLYGAPK